MERPVAIHVPTWYRFEIVGAVILRRLTGVALAVGSILLTWWLVAVAAGGGVRGNARLHRLAGRRAAAIRLVGRVFYHLCSGIRHLAGRRLRLRDPGFSSQQLRRASRDRRADRARWLYVLLA